jgi:(E)-4-hydroxy-3-methylbut-2-enyl-diphosphate synthase
LKFIKDELVRQGIQVPLVADIHYLPEAAEIAARIVEKVRINPGNYADKKGAGTRESSNKEYEEGLDRIADRLIPLLKVCKEHGTALRLGTNHGSLSDRIIFRYGNTPEGMVESALEYVRICRDYDFHDIVLSIKASNILTVLHSNRLLVHKMAQERMDYPIHLGVTEAGDGEDGRIKSAVGIGVLLSEGIGDTIRVSLTEDPVKEIPFAKRLATTFSRGDKRMSPEQIIQPPHPYHYERHRTIQVSGIGGGQLPEIFTKGFPTPEFPTVIYHYSPITEPALALRKQILDLAGKNPNLPLVINKNLGDLQGDDILIRASIDLGTALADGYGDGIQITGGTGINNARREQLAFDILQATGRRITKTEYIACPSCGRTQFDIQRALKEVKAKTSHLVGLKIAVMGCAVNGPGEMADADYGYVGAGPGKVHLYKGQKLVIRNMPQEKAVEKLLKIIQEG